MNFPGGTRDRKGRFENRLEIGIGHQRRRYDNKENNEGDVAVMGRLVEGGFKHI